MPPARVLVTGASGRIGPAVVRALGDSGLGVRVLRHRSPVPFDVESCDGDVTRPEDVRAAVRGVEFVVHLAALQQGTADELRAVNVVAAGELASAAADAGARRFVLVSSATVYAPGSFARADETHRVGPADAYGTSKLLAEKAVRAGFQRELVVLRPCSVYDDSPRCRLVLDVLELARSPRLPAGAARIDLVHADDLAQCVVAALTARRARGAYNVAGPEPAGFVAMMLELARLQGVAPELVDPHGPEASGLSEQIVMLATQERTLSIERARRELGYAPQRSWRTAFVGLARRALSAPRRPG